MSEVNTDAIDIRSEQTGKQLVKSPLSNSSSTTPNVLSTNISHDHSSKPPKSTSAQHPHGPLKQQLPQQAQPTQSTQQHPQQQPSQQQPQQQQQQQQHSVPKQTSQQPLLSPSSTRQQIKGQTTTSEMMSKSQSAQPVSNPVPDYAMTRTKSVPISIKPQPHPIAIKPRPIAIAPNGTSQQNIKSNTIIRNLSTVNNNDEITLTTSKNWILPPRPKVKKTGNCSKSKADKSSRQSVATQESNNSSKLKINSQIHSNINLMTNNQSDLKIQLQNVTKENDNLKKILVKLNKEIHNLKLVKAENDKIRGTSDNRIGIDTNSLLKPGPTDISVKLEDDLVIEPSTIDPINLSYNLESKRVKPNKKTTTSDPRKITSIEFSPAGQRPPQSEMFLSPNDIMIKPATTKANTKTTGSSKSTKPRKQESKAISTAQKKASILLAQQMKQKQELLERQRLEQELKLKLQQETSGLSAASKATTAKSPSNISIDTSKVKKERLTHACGLCSQSAPCICSSRTVNLTSGVRVKKESVSRTIQNELNVNLSSAQTKAIPQLTSVKHEPKLSMKPDSSIISELANIENFTIPPSLTTKPLAPMKTTMDTTTPTAPLPATSSDWFARNLVMDYDLNDDMNIMLDSINDTSRFTSSNLSAVAIPGTTGGGSSSEFSGGQSNNTATMGAGFLTSPRFEFKFDDNDDFMMY
ncbi:hypothetical protein CANARDRAFT_175254 [[Candida] arabinofermentans NRRL YB-2248]|uniref:Uncharacterized protein n=1 Tax=[Candida] arabinofermentans NRRL YB-2248 TaxID=983967 RepID=A0A1E4T3N1_9ASCO|nr:hypothetical protein CANARDRAFT_175254 [[Candida] arabinofermentans NRRL YB-2248]